MNLWERLEQSATKVRPVKGLKPLVLFEDEAGRPQFAGLRDARRAEDGKLEAGVDVRQSVDYQTASRSERKEISKNLKSGEVLSSDEWEAVREPDSKTVRSELFRQTAKQSVAEGINALTLNHRLTQEVEAFNETQNQQEAERRTYEKEWTPPDAPEKERENYITSDDAEAVVDREVQDLLNELNTAYTPLGPAENAGNE